MTVADNIRRIPPVTRFFTICSVMACFGSSLNIISLDTLTFNVDAIAASAAFAWPFIRSGSLVDRGAALLYLLAQSYRVFTTFLPPWGFYYNERFQALVDIYFFYTFANHLETGKFKRNFPDAVWFILVTGTFIIALSIVARVFHATYLPVYHSLMLSCIEYIWLRQEKNASINLFGIIPIKAYHLPFAKLFVGFLLRGYPTLIDLGIGIFAGYCYQCIQSGTMPGYNLLPGAYNGIFDDPARAGRRVGQQRLLQPEIIPDSIFDLGYLKAPLSLYKFLKYPVNNTVRTTAFDSVKAKKLGARRTKPVFSLSSDSDYANDPDNAGSSWSSYDAFKGKGRRLAD